MAVSYYPLVRIVPHRRGRRGGGLPCGLTERAKCARSTHPPPHGLPASDRTPRSPRRHSLLPCGAGERRARMVTTDADRAIVGADAHPWHANHIPRRAQMGIAPGRTRPLVGEAPPLDKGDVRMTHQYLASLQRHAPSPTGRGRRTLATAGTHPSRDTPRSRACIAVRRSPNAAPLLCPYRASYSSSDTPGRGNSNDTVISSRAGSTTRSGAHISRPARARMAARCPGPGSCGRPAATQAL
jgi:hypothetical protein